MTVSAATRELEIIEMIYPRDGIYRLDHAETSTQKEILRVFGQNVHIKCRQYFSSLFWCFMLL